MKTFVIDFDPPEKFQLLMYRGDVAPTPRDITAALRRRGFSAEAIERLTWSVATTRYDFGGGKRIAARES